MAKFSVNFPDYSGDERVFHDAGFSGSGNISSGFTSEDLLTVLRPAAQRLQEYYKETILRLFKRQTGSLADSFKIDESGFDRQYMDLSEASIHVGPRGKHKGSKRAARSRAGSAKEKYAKHNRESRVTSISNAELGYLLEYGTPRITATHWMQNANEQIEDEIGKIIEDGFDNLLREKGLI